MQNFFLLAVFLLSGCVSKHTFTDEQEYFNQSDTYLLEQSRDALSQHDYRAAQKMLETFTMLYPLSHQSVIVDKLLIEIHYRKDEYPMLRAATDRFIYEHPNDKDVDYVKYLRFLSSIYAAKNEYLDWIGLDYSLRDITSFKECFFEAKAFLNDYPQSAYAPAVAYELPKIKNIIARYHWLTGEDLYGRMQYIGALNAYKTILEHFSDTEYEVLAAQKIEQFHERYTKTTTLVLE